jgi:hypothetical protein
MARLEQRRLGEAQLYWVDEDMTSLALAAAACPSTEPVLTRRMPAECGFMMFASPIGQSDHTIVADMARMGFRVPQTTLGRTVDPAPVVAVSWSRWSPRDLQLEDAPDRITWWTRTPSGFARIASDFEGIWFSFYTAGGWATQFPDTPISTDPRTGRSVTAGELAAMEAELDELRLWWAAERVVRIGQPLPPPQRGTSDGWAHVVYTAWQMMSQTGRGQIAEIEEVARERRRRDRDHRAGIVEDGVVRLVRVHARNRSSPPTAPNTRELMCRSYIHPYRQNKCLNPRAHADGACEHEERIVSSHIRGPEDKPIKINPRVHVWDTPPPES